MWDPDPIDDDGLLETLDSDDDYNSDDDLIITVKGLLVITCDG